MAPIALVTFVSVYELSKEKNHKPAMLALSSHETEVGCWEYSGASMLRVVASLKYTMTVLETGWYNFGNYPNHMKTGC